ncbi:hypothetical protein DSM07_09370 [Oenococcus sp. UCMA 16435]|nr:hypothetical protein DSM07_09370 [Oenococcus sp. UCMA 16435]MDI4584791.1 hypothetical protein [Oenococcus sp. UCMA 14587]MDN6967636.1 hypothetical protein [Oenococcus sp. UCMA 17063]
MAKMEDGDFEDDFSDDIDDDLDDKIGHRIDIKFRNWAKKHPQHVIIDGKPYHHGHWHHNIVIDHGESFYGLGVMLSVGITWFVSHQDVWMTIWHGLLSWTYFGYWLAQSLH